MSDAPPFRTLDELNVLYAGASRQARTSLDVMSAWNALHLAELTLAIVLANTKGPSDDERLTASLDRVKRQFQYEMNHRKMMDPQGSA